MKKEGLLNSAGQTSEKWGYLLGMGTITWILLFGALPIGSAVNILAASGGLVFGGKLIQKSS